MSEAEPLTREEIEGYRKRITGITPFPGGPTPLGLERAKAALDNWHLRNLATHDAREREHAALVAEVARLKGLLPFVQHHSGCASRSSLLKLPKCDCGHDDALNALAGTQGGEGGSE